MAPPEINEVRRALGLGEGEDLVAEEWATSMASLPEGCPPFLRSDFVAEACAYVGLPPEVTAEVVAGAGSIAARRECVALAWHMRRLLIERKGRAGLWLVPARAFGDGAGIFNLLLLLALVPEARQFHEARGIPRPIVADTMSDFLLCMRRYRAIHGVWGVADMYLAGWLLNHLRGDIYRLGRLQYIHSSFRQLVIAFRHRVTRAVVVLLLAEREFRRDGYVNGAGGVTEQDGVWTPTYIEAAEEVIGHPVDPARGCALRYTVHLPKQQWQCVLGPGEPVLDIHIPAGSPLDPDACRDSLHRATEFFPRYFPDKPFKAFCCSSWLFDCQLEQYLPPTSNIVRFLRQFYLLPVSGDGWGAVRFVFNLLEGRDGGRAIPSDATPESIELKNLPRRTRLERAILDHIERGGHWRNSGALLLVEDLPDYGSDIYRRQAHPWAEKVKT